MRLLLIHAIVCLSLTPAGVVNAAADIKVLPIELHLPIESESLLKSTELIQQALNADGLNEIEVKAVEYWQNYQHALRKGQFGIYLAAPHYAAWAVAEHNFMPIVRLAEPLKYVIATYRASPTIFEINDLHNERVCARKPLNLDYLLINRVFDKPLLAAEIISVRSVREEMLAPHTPCSGFAISDHVFEEMTRRQPGKFIRLQQGEVYNNYVMLAHPQIPQDVIQKLRAALARRGLQRALEPLLSQFARRTNLVDAQRDDYPLKYRQPLLNYWPD